LSFTAGLRPILDDTPVQADIFPTGKIPASERCGRLVRMSAVESPTRQRSFRSLSVFLNELPIDWTDYHIIGRDRAAGDEIMQLFYADGNGQGVDQVGSDIDDDWIPSLQIVRPEIN
jgi:hypothetical protein